MTKAKNITPDHLRCVPGSCPGVYDLGDGNLLIVGRMATMHELRRCAGANIGPDETAIVISKEYLPIDDPTNRKLSEWVNADKSD